MQKLAEYWNDRSSSQKQLIGAAFLLTFLAVAGFAWLASRTPMALLYSGLDPARAGEVMAELDKTGVPSEIRGDAIWVESGERDRLRMVMAGLGLPSAGGAGYEILDGMSGFGTTSQMFDAAYWRAKEGELARTILALPNVKTARVHLAVPSGRGYRREVAGTASVTLTTNGAPVERAQAHRPPVARLADRIGAHFVAGLLLCLVNVAGCLLAEPVRMPGQAAVPRGRGWHGNSA